MFENEKFGSSGTKYGNNHDLPRPSNFANTLNEYLVGFKHRSTTDLNLLAVSTLENNPDLKKFENKYHLEAKKGIEYWPRYKRPPTLKSKGYWDFRIFFNLINLIFEFFSKLNSITISQ